MLILFFVLLMISIVFIFYKDYLYNQYLFTFLVFICSIITAFQVNYGPDYKNYINIYNMDLEIPKTFGFLSTNLILYLRQLKLPAQSFFVCFGILLAIMLFYTIDLLKKNNIISNKLTYLILLILVGRFYLETFNTIRTTIGSLFFIASFFDFKKGRTDKIKKMVFYFIGIGIHPSIILLFPCFIIKQIFFKKISIYVWFLLLSFCFMIKNIQLVKIIAIFIYKYFPNFIYRNYLVSKYLYTGVTGTNIVVTIYFFMLLLSLRYYKDENNTKKIFILNLIYLLFSFQYIVFGSMIFERIICLFAFIFPYVYYYLDDKIKTIDYGIVIIKLIICIVCFLIFIKSFY